MVRFRNVKKGNEGIVVNLTPLLDVIFNLLIFLLITAAVTVKGINLDLPEASTSSKMPSKSWEIIIDENEKIVFNEAVIDWTRLKRIFDAERGKPEGERVTSIILKANRKTSFGAFVRIMDTARQYGFYNLVIATDPGRENKVER
jgi:biopolymer transport protein ExbD